MTEAYIYDAVRTPRGKGKKDGSLHQATPVWLLRTLLQACSNATTWTPRWSMTWCWAA
jgi:acetyl-CoA acetyltransferase